MNEIKPCPFCGGTEIYLYTRGVRYGKIAYAKCEVCGATSKAFSYYDEGKEINPNDIGFQKALAAWNRRTPENNGYSEIIERLRRLQEPEQYEPQITQETFEALEIAIRIIEAMERMEDDGK